MKTLVSKEIRENVKLAAVGLIIYALLLLAQYRSYVGTPGNPTQPLGDDSLLWSTAWFCGIFGAVLGWLQIHNERRPDLWAFLLHRPMTRTSIFLAKTLAGLGVYIVVVGVPLLAFAIWARWPGHVAAPFEVRMMRPVAAFIVAGILFYFSGMLTGLRQARWYASRALGVVAALAVCLFMFNIPHAWQAFLILFIGAAILITAAWGGFQSHGYYRGQPPPGKVALAITLMVGALIVACLGALLIGVLLPAHERTAQWSYYVVSKSGTVARMTQHRGGAAEVADPEGKPLMNPKTGRPFEAVEFGQQVQNPRAVETALEELPRPGMWSRADFSLAINWHDTSDTLWYYWRKYGRLVGYDIHTRRPIGSIGPNGFAPTLAGAGDRFSSPEAATGSRTLCTATTLYRLHVDKKSTQPLFTTASDDPIINTVEINLNNDDWTYTAVATKKFIYLLTPDGQPVWKLAYESKDSDYRQANIYILDQPGQFLVLRAPSYRDDMREKWTLPTHVVWLARDAGVVRTADLPALPVQRPGPGPQEILIFAVMAPVAWMTVPWIEGLGRAMLPPGGLLLLNGAVAALVCLPIGLWLGRRYRFSAGAQVGWAVFHLLCGVPGLLAFLSVQEWPTREPCPNCKRLRMVDREQCEHCGAAFAPPETAGTEVLVPLQQTATQV